MSSFLEWINMGGYGIYIWPAYIIACIVMIINVLTVKIEKKAVSKNLDKWYKKKSYESS